MNINGLINGIVNYGRDEGSSTIECYSFKVLDREEVVGTKTNYVDSLSLFKFS